MILLQFFGVVTYFEIDGLDYNYIISQSTIL